MMNKKHLIGEGFKHVFLIDIVITLCIPILLDDCRNDTDSSADITMGKLTFGNKLAENVTNAL